jgi:flagellar protein FliS
MFGAMQYGASAYARVGVENGVTAATPHQLIVMLFDGARVALADALAHMGAGNIAAKGSAVSKAISIVENGLRASLDKSTGGEIAANLDALYAYMGERMVMANLNNDPAMLEEVRQLLDELKTAWAGIAPQAPRLQDHQDVMAQPQRILPGKG